MLENNIDLNSSTVLVTGAAGFIGSYLVKRLLTQFPGARVVGMDSITDYYDTSLKYARLDEIASLAADRAAKGAAVPHSRLHSKSDPQRMSKLHSKCHPQRMSGRHSKSGPRTDKGDFRRSDGRKDRVAYI